MIETCTCFSNYSCIIRLPRRQIEVSRRNTPTKNPCNWTHFLASDCHFGALAVVVPAIQARWPENAWYVKHLFQQAMSRCRRSQIPRYQGVQLVLAGSPSLQRSHACFLKTAADDKLRSVLIYVLAHLTHENTAAKETACDAPQHKAHV